MYKLLLILVLPLFSMVKDEDIIPLVPHETRPLARKYKKIIAQGTLADVNVDEKFNSLDYSELSQLDELVQQRKEGLKLIKNNIVPEEKKVNLPGGKALYCMQESHRQAKLINKKTTSMPSEAANNYRSDETLKLDLLEKLIKHELDQWSVTYVESQPDANGERMDTAHWEYKKKTNEI